MSDYEVSRRHRQPTDKIAYANWHSQLTQEVFPGIKATELWQGENKGKAIVVNIEPGGKWQGVDVHETSSEEIFVVSGVFNDGKQDYEAGTFIHYPLGLSHVPQSDLKMLRLKYSGSKKRSSRHQLRIRSSNSL